MFSRLTALALTCLALLLIVACAPSATPAPTAAPPFSQAPASASSRAPVPTAAPPAAPAPASSAASSVSSGTSANIIGAGAQRKIIKNAQLQLTVESTDVALDRLTGITVDTGGYIISTRVFTEQGLKAATITFAVPVDQFESALRRVRGVALKVEQENSSGQDVTDQYVDLESQVRNLEATADRIREFLKKAQTVDEALKVNQQLAQVEKDIETLKGKMNYLGDRSAFSTITAELREPKPTPTPPPVFPTATPTPTPTPVVWQPGATLQKAVDTQTSMFTSLVQTLTDLTIWLVIVFLPYMILFGVIAWVVMRVRKWFTKSASVSPPNPPETS